MITSVTQPDVIIFAGGLGGLLMWLSWYRKGSDTDYFFNIDTTSKKIRLGLYPSLLVAILSGSAIGFYANMKGWEPNDAAIGAFFVGLIATWGVKGLLNNSYNGVCKLAQSKWFGDNVSQYIPTRHNQEILPPPGSQYGKTLSTISTIPGNVPQTAQDWTNQKALLTEQFIILQNRGAISKEEMMNFHQLLPDIPDFEELRNVTQGLMQQQQNLTIGQKTDLTNIILTQQNQIGRQSELLDIQQDRLEKAGLTLDPQNRIPKEVVYVTLGAILRHLIGWIL